MVCQAHGANRGATCGKCHREQDMHKLQKMIKDDQVMRCDKCDGAVKPDITFFGEGLPNDFFNSCKTIQESEPDLLIVCGTALAVSPFKNIVGMVSSNVPKVLFNMEDVFETSGY